MHLILVLMVAILVFGGRRLIRGMARLALAGALALMAAIWLAGPHFRAVPLAMLIGLPMLALARRLIRSRPRAVSRTHASVAAARPSSLNEDWAALRRSLGWSAGRLDAAGDTFGRFLALADGAPFSPETEELVIHIRKRAPELIAQALADCRTASPAERRQRLGETLDALERLARRAEARRADLWREQGAAFEAKRVHLVGRIGPDPLASA